MTRVAVTPIIDGDAELRMLTDQDLPTTLAWRNHPDSRRWFHSTDVIALADHERWFRNYLGRDDDYVFIIEVAGVKVAQVALYDISDGSAEFGRLLVDPAARGAGFAYRATMLCLKVADETLGLHDVHLEVKDDNVRAIRVYEKAGFRAEERPAAVGGSIVMRRVIE